MWEKWLEAGSPQLQAPWNVGTWTDADEFVDEGGESVATAENDGGDTTTDEPTTFLLVDTANDLPFLAFVGGLFTVLALIATDVGFVVFGGRLV